MEVRLLDQEFMISIALFACVRKTSLSIKQREYAKVQVTPKAFFIAP